MHNLPVKLAAIAGTSLIATQAQAGGFNLTTPTWGGINRVGLTL